MYLWRVIDLNGSILFNEITGYYALPTFYEPGTYMVMVQGNSEMHNAVLFNASKLIICKCKYLGVS